jgi:hypothetical protein
MLYGQIKLAKIDFTGVKHRSPEWTAMSNILSVAEWKENTEAIPMHSMNSWADNEYAKIKGNKNHPVYSEDWGAVEKHYKLR